MSTRRDVRGRRYGRLCVGSSTSAVYLQTARLPTFQRSCRMFVVKQKWPLSLSPAAAAADDKSPLPTHTPSALPMRCVLRSSISAISCVVHCRVVGNNWLHIQSAPWGQSKDKPQSAAVYTLLPFAMRAPVNGVSPSTRHLQLRIPTCIVPIHALAEPWLNKSANTL